MPRLDHWSRAPLAVLLPNIGQGGMLGWEQTWCHGQVSNPSIQHLYAVGKIFTGCQCSLCQGALMQRDIKTKAPALLPCIATMLLLWRDSSWGTNCGAGLLQAVICQEALCAFCLLPLSLQPRREDWASVSMPA